MEVSIWITISIPSTCHAVNVVSWPSQLSAHTFSDKIHACIQSTVVNYNRKRILNWKRIPSTDIINERKLNYPMNTLTLVLAHSSWKLSLSEWSENVTKSTKMKMTIDEKWKSFLSWAPDEVSSCELQASNVRQKCNDAGTDSGTREITESKPAHTTINLDEILTRQSKKRLRNFSPVTNAVNQTSLSALLVPNQLVLPRRVLVYPPPVSETPRWDYLDDWHNQSSSLNGNQRKLESTKSQSVFPQRIFPERISPPSTDPSPVWRTVEPILRRNPALIRSPYTAAHPRLSGYWRRNNLSQKLGYSSASILDADTVRPASYSS